MNPKRLSTRKKETSFRVEIGMIVTGLVFMHLPLITAAFRGDTLDAERASQFGDFVGGYIGTGFLLASVVLLWTTLRDQMSSNEHQKFEALYFELLKFHRENVAEIEVGTRHGRAAFVTFIREWRACDEITCGICGAYAPQLKQEEIINISYLVFYYGTGPNSNRQLKSALKRFDPDLVKRLVEAFDSDTVKEAVRLKRKFSFVPFEGHQSRLGHYYRHLYQTIKYVKSHPDEAEAERYADLLRAQMSNHEQALFCLNAISDLGRRVWRDEGLINRFQLIKNVPEDFFDLSELKLTDFFPNVSFEYMNPRSEEQSA